MPLCPSSSTPIICTTPSPRARRCFGVCAVMGCLSSCGGFKSAHTTAAAVRQRGTGDEAGLLLESRRWQASGGGAGLDAARKGHEGMAAEPGRRQYNPQTAPDVRADSWRNETGEGLANQHTHTHTHTGGRSLGNALLSAAYRLICGGIVKRCRSHGKASVAQQQQGVPVGPAVLAWLECCQQQDPANNNRSLGNALPMTYEARGKALSNDRRSFAGPCRPSQPAVVDKALPRTAGIRSWLGTLCLACKPSACTISSLVGLPITQMASRISLARRPALWQGKPWNELVARDNTNPCNNPFVAMRCCNGPAAAMAGQGSADADRTSLGRQSRRGCPSPRSIERPHRHRRPPGPRGKASSTRSQ